MTRILGPAHTDTLTIRDTFALLLHARGRLDEAEAEIRAVLEFRDAVLGPGHPDTVVLATALRELRHLAGVSDDRAPR